MDPHVSQEKSKKSSFEPCFPAEEIVCKNSGAPSQTAGLCWILDLSSYTKTSGTKQLSTNYQPTEPVSWQMRCQKSITLSNSAKWKTSDCFLRPKGAVQAVCNTINVRHLIRVPPEYHVLVDPRERVYLADSGM